ncbi:macrophage mannose receptor 1-like [Salarias fasciatus]|uniref:macrophage mannose receptor 1-like n=1 Tax=Salarias fasciatus TaxID=181472 RepID=UPI001176AAB5|nr:macrophage mannose receptor 1-like [Salarias fasciatus]
MWYSWSDGTPLSHTNWADGEPNNHEGREECVEMVSSPSGTYSWWNDLNCDAHQDWICKIVKGKEPVEPRVAPTPLPALECGSNPGWRKYNGICYYYNDTDMVDFHTAVLRCYAEKALLVSILNQHEQAYVNRMVGTGKVSAAWIGLRKFGVASGQYLWVDNSPVSYTHWSPGEPNNANGEEQCVQMNRHQGGWNDVNCGWAGAGYVCKKYHGDDHTAPPPTQPWEGNCPEGWMRFKDKCFLFKGKANDIHGSWFFARDWCKDQGANLAVIDSQDENNFVTSYLKDLQHQTWIGLSDLLVENQYAWSDGVSSVLYTNWNDNEPNNVGGAEHCVAITHTMVASGRWNDDACSKNHSFVCSMKKSSSIDPSPATKRPCPSGYISWYQNCYKLVEEAASWEAAQAACRQQDRGDLVSVDSSYEQAFLSGVVLQGKHEAWMGLRRQGDGSYKWSDGWPVFFTQWGPGEPSNLQDEGCVSMHAAFPFHGTWNDTDCAVAKSYICKISYDSPPPTPAPGDGQCVLDFVPYGRHCYYTYDGRKGFSWSEAQHSCQQAHAELASFHSRAEVEFIVSLNRTKYLHLWIGLTRDRNFSWGWTDKTAVGFLNWAAGEPNAAFHPGETGEEECVEMYHDGLWNDNNCLERRGFVCRHRQYYHTDENKDPVFPTDDPGSGSDGGNGGVIAGAVIGVIGAILVVCLICKFLFDAIRARGRMQVSISFSANPTSSGVLAFNNPNV